MKTSLSFSTSDGFWKRTPTLSHAPTPIFGSNSGFPGGGGGGRGGRVTGVEAASAASVGATTSPGGGVGRAGPADSPAGGSSSATAIAGATASNEESTNETRFPYLFVVRAIPCDLLRVIETAWFAQASPKLRASDP